jgi:hypothetical protein
VYTIWCATLAVTLVVFVPLAVYLLHRTWRAAHSIQRYAADALLATRGIAGNTQHIRALDATISAGGDLLQAAGAAGRTLDATARALGARAV